MKKLKAGINNYGTIREAMEQVFNRNNIQMMRSNHHIKEDKYACFYHLAQKSKIGGWFPPDDRVWLNIPDSDGKAFTQINLQNEISQDNPLEGKECAIFMRNNGFYQFFGVFKQSDFERGDRICIFERISDELDIDEWK